MTQFDPPADRDPARRPNAEYVIRPGDSIDASSDDDDDAVPELTGSDQSRDRRDAGGDVSDH